MNTGAVDARTVMCSGHPLRHAFSTAAGCTATGCAGVVRDSAAACGVPGMLVAGGGDAAGCVPGMLVAGGGDAACCVPGMPVVVGGDAACWVPGMLVVGGGDGNETGGWVTVDEGSASLGFGAAAAAVCCRRSLSSNDLSLTIASYSSRELCGIV